MTAATPDRRAAVRAASWSRAPGRRPWWVWAAPFALVLSVLMGTSAAAMVHAPPPSLGTALAVGAAVLAVASLAVAPATAADTINTEAALPDAVTAVAASAHGKTIVVYLDHNAWPDVTGFLVQAERTGVRACVQNPWWMFMMSRQFICTQGQVAGGAPFWFNSPSATRGATVIARLNRSEITAGASP